MAIKVWRKHFKAKEDAWYHINLIEGSPLRSVELNDRSLSSLSVWKVYWTNNGAIRLVPAAQLLLKRSKSETGLSEHSKGISSKSRNSTTAFLSVSSDSPPSCSSFLPSYFWAFKSSSFWDWEEYPPTSWTSISKMLTSDFHEGGTSVSSFGNEGGAGKRPQLSIKSN